MRIVIDTNVLISGAFFSGPPSRILDACSAGRHEMVVSPEILEEYIRVGSEFSSQRANFDFERFLALLLSGSLLVEAVPGPSQICADPDDDKFIHCALAAGAPKECPIIHFTARSWAAKTRSTPPHQAAGTRARIVAIPQLHQEQPWSLCARPGEREATTRNVELFPGNRVF